MGKPIVKRILTLDFLGDDWKGCEIVFTRLTMPEQLELSKYEDGVNTAVQANKVFDEVKKLMAKHFIRGTGFMGEAEDGSRIIEPLTIENLTDDIFMDIYIPLLKALRGITDENL